MAENRKKLIGKKSLKPSFLPLLEQKEKPLLLRIAV